MLERLRITIPFVKDAQGHIHLNEDGDLSEYRMLPRPIQRDIIHQVGRLGFAAPSRTIIGTSNPTCLEVVVDVTAQNACEQKACFPDIPTVKPKVVLAAEAQQREKEADWVEQHITDAIRTNWEHGLYCFWTTQGGLTSRHQQALKAKGYRVIEGTDIRTSNPPQHGYWIVWDDEKAVATGKITPYELGRIDLLPRRV